MQGPGREQDPWSDELRDDGFGRYDNGADDGDDDVSSGNSPLPPGAGLAGLFDGLSWRPLDLLRALICLAVLPALPLLTIDLWAPPRWSLVSILWVAIAIHLVGGTIGWAVALRWMGRAPAAPNVVVLAGRLLAARIARMLLMICSALFLCLPAMPLASLFRLPLGAVASGRPFFVSFNSRLVFAPFRRPALFGVEVVLFALELVAVFPAASPMAFEALGWPERVALLLGGQLFLFLSLATGSAGAGWEWLPEADRRGTPARGRRWVAGAVALPIALAVTAFGVSLTYTGMFLVRASMAENAGQWAKAESCWGRVPGPWMRHTVEAGLSRARRMQSDPNGAYAGAVPAWEATRAGSIGRASLAVEIGMCCIDSAWEVEAQAQRTKFREARMWFERGRRARERDSEIEALAEIWDVVALAGTGDQLPADNALDRWLVVAPDERLFAPFNVATAIRNRADERVWPDDVEAYRVAEGYYTRALNDPAADPAVRMRSHGAIPYVVWQQGDYERAEELFQAAFGKLHGSHLTDARVDHVYFCRDWADQADDAVGLVRLEYAVDSVEALLQLDQPLHAVTEGWMRSTAAWCRVVLSGDDTAGATEAQRSLEAALALDELPPGDRADILVDMTERLRGYAEQPWVGTQGACTAWARTVGHRYLAEAPPAHPRRAAMALEVAQLEWNANRRDEATRLFQVALAAEQLEPVEIAQTWVKLGRLDWERVYNDDAGAQVAERGLGWIAKALAADSLEGVDLDEAIWFRVALLGGIGEWETAKRELREALAALPEGDPRREALLRERVLMWSRFVFSEAMDHDNEEFWTTALGAVDAYLREAPADADDRSEVVMEQAYLFREWGKADRSLLAASGLVASLDADLAADRVWIEEAADHYRAMASQREVERGHAVFAQAARWYLELAPYAAAPERKGVLRANAAWCLWGHEEFAQAEAEYDRAAELLKAGGDVETFGVVRRNVSRLLLDWVEHDGSMEAQVRLDRLFRARAMATEGTERLTPLEAARAHIRSAVCSIVLGEVKRARASLATAQSLEKLAPEARRNLFDEYAKAIDDLRLTGDAHVAAQREAAWGWRQWLDAAPADHDGRQYVWRSVSWMLHALGGTEAKAEALALLRTALTESAPADELLYTYRALHGQTIAAWAEGESYGGRERNRADLRAADAFIAQFLAEPVGEDPIAPRYLWFDRARIARALEDEAAARKYFGVATDRTDPAPPVIVRAAIEAVEYLLELAEKHPARRAELTEAAAKIIREPYPVESADPDAEFSKQLTALRRRVSGK